MWNKIGSCILYWTRPWTSASASDIGTYGADRLGVSGPPKIRVLKPVYMKGLVSEKVHAGGVYSTFGSSTSKYPLKTPLRALGFFGEKLHA